MIFIRLENDYDMAGSGMIGNLQEPVDEHGFLATG